MITKEQLLEFGFIEVEDDSKIMFPFKKVLSEPNEDDDEQGELALVISRLRNGTDFCIITPTGEMIYVNGAKNLEELKIVEQSITGWEGNS